MKRMFIVHGWDYNSSMHWYPWIKKELERKGFEVFVLDMPNSSEPKIKEWTNHLKNKVGKLDSNTFFIGHSMGCQTIMRYLQFENVKIGGAFFVAGWFYLDNLEGEEVEQLARPWLENNINLKKVKNIINKLIVFLSYNDPYNCLEENSLKFKNDLGAEVIILKDKGHFTKEDGVLTLKELIEKI